MRTRASIAGRPIHVMAVAIPIGLWIFSLVCDVIQVSGHNPDLWFTVAYITMAGGLVGALVAAIFGFIDLSGLPHGHARAVALTHMGLNLGVVALYAVNLWLRTGDLDSMLVPLLLSVAAIATLALSGWLGGELVHIYMIGVDADEGAKRAAAERSPGVPRPSAHDVRGEPAPRDLRSHS